MADMTAPEVQVIDRKVKKAVEGKAPFYTVEESRGEERGKLICELQLVNPHAEDVCFKILSNSKTMYQAERFIVNPAAGHLKGSGTSNDRCMNVQIVARDEHQPGKQTTPVKQKMVRDTFRLQVRGPRPSSGTFVPMFCL